MADDKQDPNAADEKQAKPRKMRGWSPSLRGGYQPTEGDGGGPPTGGSGASKKPGE